MKKRVLFVIAAIVGSAMFAACNPPETPTTSETTTTTTTVSPFENLLWYGASSVSVYGDYVYDVRHGYIVLMKVTNVQSAEALTNNLIPWDSGTENYCTSLIQGHYLYITSYKKGFFIYDLSSPQSPALVTNFNINALAFTLQNNYAYISGNDAFTVIDVSDPQAAHIVSASAVTNWYFDIAVDGNYAYLADSNYKQIVIYDISVPSSPAIKGTCHAPNPCYSLSVNSNYLYVAEGNGGVVLYEIDNNTNLVIKSAYSNANEFSLHLEKYGNYLFEGSDGKCELRIYDCQTVSNISLLCSMDEYGYVPMHMLLTNDILFVPWVMSSDGFLSLYDFGYVLTNYAVN